LYRVVRESQIKSLAPVPENCWTPIQTKTKTNPESSVFPRRRIANPPEISYPIEAAGFFLFFPPFVSIFQLQVSTRTSCTTKISFIAEVGREGHLEYPRISAVRLNRPTSTITDEAHVQYSPNRSEMLYTQCVWNASSHHSRFLRSFRSDIAA